MSLNGSVCFFVLYHYETNMILATPVVGLDNKSIFNAYKMQFDNLTSKGYKLKINIMDNQATKHIKELLMDQQCQLQLVKPHNHRLNAAKRAIQTFKDAFIAALATTNSDFPLQLWDKITPQVQNTLNMMRVSCIDQIISAYEQLNGPYNWNQYPLAPLGCKAVIYKDGNTRGSWASKGIDGWYLGPPLDHYQCSLFYVPETQAYCISGSAELFPQHCQILNMSPHQHLHALADELRNLAAVAASTSKGRRLLKLLQSNLQNILNPPPLTATPRTEQKVTKEQQRAREEEQRVINDTPILTIPRITNAPPIMQARNPTAKRALKNMTRIHQRQTRANTSGGVPKTARIYPIPNIDADTLSKKSNNCRMSLQAPGGGHKHKRPPTPHQLLLDECQLEPNNNLCHNKQ